MKVLDPLKIDLSGHALIEASAGTGKTYTITSLFLRFLLELELEVRNILIVTFTQAATEELRDRVRKRLKQALDCARGEKCRDEFISSLLEKTSAGCSREKTLFMLERAIISLDEAAIFTIHGFCQRMLNEYAFETASAFDAELAPSQDDILLEAARECWRQKFYHAEPWLGSAATSLFSRPERMLDTVRPLLGPVPIRIEPAATLKDCLAEKVKLDNGIRELKDLWSREREQIVKTILEDKALKRQKNVLKKNGIEGAAATLDELFSREELSPFSLDCTGEVPFSLEFLSTYLKKGFESPALHPFFLKWDEVRGPCRGWCVRLKSALLNEAVTGINKISSTIKKQRGYFSFDDLLLRMNKALSPPAGKDLAKILRCRFRAALIDEFQDTDPVQYSIFERIYPVPDRDRLVLIGDPKQSIYGFRGADIFTYLKAGSRVGKRRRFGLARNWRSSPGLVKAVNLLFSRPGRPFVYRDIPYSKVKSRDPRLPALIDPEIPGDFIIWSPEKRFKEGRQPAVIKKGVAIKAISEGCAVEIARLLEGGRKREIQIEEVDGTLRPLKAGDIAILVKSRTHAGKVKEALSSAGISCVYHARESVFSTKEARDFLMMLKAAASPGDLGALSTALATEAGGWTAAEIDKLRRDEIKWNKLSSIFQELYSLWHKSSFLVMFRVMLHRLGIGHRLLSLPGGERRLTNWFQLSELFQEAADDAPGMEGGLSWLSTRISLHESADEEQQLRLENDRELVTIMTIHKSKGLEFPVVFVPFAWDISSTQKREDLTRYYDRQRGCYVVEAEKTDKADAEAEYQRLAEELRLLYVALTRARVRCCISWGNFKDAEKSALKYLLQETGDTALLKCPSVNVTPIPEKGPGVEDLADSAACLYSVRVIERPVRQVFGVESFSSLVLDNHDDTEAPDIKKMPSSPSPIERNIFSFPRGAAPGNCIHSVLETMDFSAENRTDLLENCRRGLVAWGLEVKWQDVLAEMVQNVISTEILPGLRLRDICPDEMVREMEFTSFFRKGKGEKRISEGAGLLLSRYDSGMICGFIDLLFQKDDRYYIADYKSNYLGDSLDDYRLPALQQAMEEHGYHLQAEIYALALHRLLLKTLPGYNFHEHFGGVLYLFARGIRPSSKGQRGVYFIAPEQIAPRAGTA